MKVFCIAALSADGFIAKNAEDTLEWRSLEDKRFFREKTMEAGVVVMGKNTYESIGKSLKGRLNLVYSLEPIEGVETTQKEPRELLSELEKRGYEQVAVIGGSSVYTQFLQA
ncbi:MAG: dihydrofolate reductase, partial [Patescibacteria group bacterium]